MIRFLPYFNYSILYIGYTFIFCLSSCNKGLECEDASFCVTNSSATNTKFISFNNSEELIELTPNSKVCTKVAPFKTVKKKRGKNSETSVFSGYDCEGEYYTHEMESCDEVVECECLGENLTEFCDNGKFDPLSGEQDIDCGGYCGDCPAFFDKCPLHRDSIIMDDYMGDLASLKTTYGKQFSDNITLNFAFTQIGNVTGNNRSGLITATIKSTSFPQFSRIFEIGTNEEQISISYKREISHSDADLWDADTSQTVQLIKGNDGNWRLNMCNIAFQNSNYSSSSKATLQGQLHFSSSEIDLNE